MATKKSRLENYRYPDKFGELIGYKIKKMDRKKGLAIVTLNLREDHLSPAQKIHGGVVSSFFDFASGAAVFTTLSPRDFCSTVEIKVNYFQPLIVGDRLRAEAKVVFRGKRLCVVHALAYREKDRSPVAMSTATFNVVTTG